MSSKVWSLNAYLMAFRDEDGIGLPTSSGYRSEFPLVKRITCADGFSLSVQATRVAYCSPRENIGPWWKVEVGYPSASEGQLMQYAEEEDRPTETVYPYVPVEVVEAVIHAHGGPNAEAIAKATGEQQ